MPGGSNNVMAAAKAMAKIVASSAVRIVMRRNIYARLPM